MLNFQVTKLEKIHKERQEVRGFSWSGNGAEIGENELFSSVADTSLVELSPLNKNAS